MINKNWRIIILFLTVFTFVLYSTSDLCRRAFNSGGEY